MMEKKYSDLLSTRTVKRGAIYHVLVLSLFIGCSAKANERRKVREDRAPIADLCGLKSSLDFLDQRIKKIEETDGRKQLIDVLERTNQQVALWSNPYSFLVSVLSVLFTVLTIVAVFIVYRQGSDYKKKIEDDRAEHKNKLKELVDTQLSVIHDRDKKAEAMSVKIKESFDDIIAQYRKKLDSTTAEQKEKIDAEILRLQSEKAQSLSQLGATGSSAIVEYANNYTYASLSKDFHNCNHCGFGFKLLDMGMGGMTLSALAGYGNRTVTCPKCGNVDRI